MLDVLCEVSDQFLVKESMSKGTMNLVSRERSNYILKLIEPIKETAGGSAANTISTLAKLGLNTGYIGKIANDPKGKLFKKDMLDNSIFYNTKFLDKNNSEATGKCIVLITPDKERTMNTYLGATEFLTEIDIDEELIAQSDWLYLEGYRFDGKKSKEAFYKAIEIARKNETRIAITLSDSFCVDRHRSDFINLLNTSADIVFCNEEELKSLYQIEDIRIAQNLIAKKNETKIAITLSDSFCVDRHRSDFINLLNTSADTVFCNEEELKSLYQIEDIRMAQNLIAKNISCLACTCAEKGAYLFHESSITKISTKEVPVIDTTGAGDNFAAGFLYGLSKNFTLKDSASFGNLIAGEVLKVYGPRIEKSLKNFIVD